MVKIFIFAIFLYACSVTAQKPTISQLYDDCGTPGKKCWGDRDGCIESRQCTYAMSVGQNSTHYTIIMVNGCAEPKKTLKHFFLGVGYDTFDANGVRVCRDPSIDDFKGFIFWKDGVKCPPGRTYAFEIFWTYRKKDNLRRMCEYEQNVHGTKIEPKFNLTNYMRNYVFLKAGDDTYPYEFADKTDYKYVNGLYINRQPATVEPEDPKIPISVKPYAPEVPIGYHGNDTTGNGGGATYRIPDATGKKIRPAQLYDDCGKGSKKCWGDVDGCLETRTCAFAIGVWENATDYTVAILNNCGEPNKASKDYFVGVGYDTLNADGYTICREPRIDDFKGFIFWDRRKCPVKTHYQVYWTYRNKETLRRLCEYDEQFGRNRIPAGRFNLRNYLTKYIIIADGDDKAPFAFADRVDYKFTDNLYINRYQAPSEPGLPVEPETNALASYHGNGEGDDKGAGNAVVIGLSGLLCVLVSSLVLIANGFAYHVGS